MREISRVVKENKRRYKKLFAHYDPILGIGSPLKRFRFDIDNATHIFLPHVLRTNIIIQQILKSGSIYQYVIDNNNGKYSEERFNFMVKEVMAIRVTEDFEYWAADKAYIQDKITGEYVLFVLNRPQRKTLVKYERRRISGKPIRAVILKARQWGGSTLTQVYMLWIQTFHKRGWSSVVCADIKDKAKHIRGMFGNLADRHDKDLAPITLKPYMQSQEHKMYMERDCMIGVGSSENPLAFNAYSFYMAHLSEVGLYKKTEKTDPKELVQSIASVIPNRPYTLIVKESTARGVGTLFHDEWLKAKSGESGYDAIFVAWWEIELYVLPISDYEKFIASMSPRDWELWDKGATLEGIHWYNEHKRKENFDDWRMAENFPSDPDEAFQSSGQRAFAPSYVKRCRINNCDPVLIGDIFGASNKGKQALEDIKIEPNDKGLLRVWTMPPTERLCTRRFAIFVDIGGRTEKADFSVIKVFDRLYMTEGGVPEVAAVWSGHLDQDLVAWKAAQIGKAYDMGLIAIEVNSLRKEKESSEGDHYLTVLDEIAPYYDNLFARVDPEKVRLGAPVLYGFHTNMKTKPMIVDTLNAALRDEGYIERDSRACDEMDWYETKPDGSYGAVEGKHDDHVIVTAGGLWLCLSYMDFPKIVDPSTNRVKSRPNYSGHAKF